eukprot:TRINITY_DN8632_c0_g1_i1.p1 TRINITY_DN8632_c0_g1~~TRINITY_DN8632_c0_g1_i1.p1  ORF type:complete len:510 (+),score=99.07 TRINITY_DN8632_c0_g1_i1:149-1678(+)
MLRVWSRQKLHNLLSHHQVFRNDIQNPFLSVFYFTEIAKKKGKITPTQKRRIIDRFRLWVKGGPGGNGCTCYRKSVHKRHGTPDGGDGGRGGDVILECSDLVWDLSNLQHHLKAQKGGNGLPKNRVGSRGADKVVQVPVGTVVHLVSGELPSPAESHSSKERFPWELSDGENNNDEHVDSDNSNILPSNGTRIESQEVSTSCKTPSQIDNMRESKDNNYYESETNYESETKEYENGLDSIDYDSESYEVCEQEIQYSVAELIKPGQCLLVASGGSGGRGNFSMARIRSGKKLKPKPKQNVTGMPVCDHELGHPGSEVYIILELKMIADVGLVGMPNAGKSTLIGAMSRARPTVGNYAFTTLRPSIGKVEYDDFFSITVADIPGLIKGAHENRGLGHAFLRHIEKTQALAYVIDLSTTLPSPWEQLKDLVFELEHHQPGLSNRASLIVANKIDEVGAEDSLKELKRRVPSAPIFPVCAVLEEGIPELKFGLRQLINGSESWKPDVTNCVD